MSIHPVGGAALGAPQVTLTAAGRAARQYILGIDRAYGGSICVDCYAIMPDHIHLLLLIRSPAPGSPRAATPTALPRAINALKGLCSKKLGRSLWQRGYFEHIIRNDRDLDETRRYIQANPSKWIANKE